MGILKKLAPAVLALILIPFMVWPRYFLQLPRAVFDWRGQYDLGEKYGVYVATATWPRNLVVCMTILAIALLLQGDLKRLLSARKIRQDASHR
jgi:hypothetical protein